MIELTVAICTYRRVELLRLTLDSLVSMRKPEFAWELLVVDNEGSAAVRQLAEGYSGRLPIRYVCEATTGCSHARNRALAEAAGPVILFTDDDAIADRNWLVEMSRAIREQPECAFWGGRVRPVWGNLPQPDWYDETACPMLRDVIVQYDLGAESRLWNPANDPPFFTCNLALRVESANAAGRFDTALGHIGSNRVGGEDTRLVEALHRNGNRGWYTATASVDHPVPEERIAREYAYSFARRQGDRSYRLLMQDHNGRLPRWAYRAAAQQWAGGVLKWLRGVATRNVRLRFAGRMAIAFAAAKLRTVFGKGGTN